MLRVLKQASFQPVGLAIRLRDGIPKNEVRNSVEANIFLSTASKLLLRPTQSLIRRATVPLSSKAKPPDPEAYHFSSN